jgi:hypothetical protein
MLVREDEVGDYINWLIDKGALKVAYEGGSKVLYPDMDRMKKIAPAAHDIFYGSLLAELGQSVEAGYMDVEFDDKSGDFLFTTVDVEEDSVA